MEIVSSLYKFKNKRSPASYRDQIQSLAGLPTLPIIASEVSEMTRNDKVSVSQMVPVIDKDPTLGMKLLKVANSAYYGMQEKVTSLRHAIVIIGLNELASIAVGFSVLKAFRIDNHSGDIDWKHFWEHSAAVGHVAEIFRGELRLLRMSGSPYSLGLLHDIGKLVLYRIDPKNYLEAMKVAQSKQCSTHTAEMEVFGIDHMDAGKCIAEKWRLPEVVSIVIGNHHHPGFVSDHAYLISTALVELADIVTNLKGISFGTQFIPDTVEGWDDLMAENNQNEELDLDNLVDRLNDHFIHIRDMVQILEV